MGVPTAVRLQKSINYLVAQLELLAQSPSVDLNQLTLVYASITHSTYAHEWPFNAILPDIERIMHDGLNEAEAKKLNGKLKQLFTSMGRPAGVDLNEDQPIIFPDRTFCFTGVFELGHRKDCHEIVLSLGGEPKEEVILSLDYLVVGKYSAPDWKFSKFGRKIQKVVATNSDKAKKHKIRIVSEDYFTVNADAAKKLP